MWRAKPRRFLILGASRIVTGIDVGGRWVPGSIEERTLGPTEDCLDDLLGHLRTLLPSGGGEVAKTRSSDWVVLLSDRWLRWLALPWSNGLGRHHEAQAHCRQQFGAAWGSESMTSVFAYDDAPYEAMRLAVALESSFLEALETLARASNARLSLVQPLAVTSWHWAKRSCGPAKLIFALAEVGELTLFLADKGRLQWVETTGGSGLSPETVLRRQVLRDPVWAEVDRGCCLDLDGTSSWDDGSLSWEAITPPVATGEEVPPVLRLATHAEPSALDFVTRPAAPSRPRLAMLAASTLLLMVVAGLLVREQGRLDRVNADVAARRTVVMPPPSAAEQRTDDARVRAANEAIRKLNVPVTRVLRAVQPPKDLRIALLSLDFSDATADKPLLRITAEARSGADMAAYVGHLGDTRPFSGAYLVRHELLGADASRPYRFSVEAPWQD